MNSNHMSVSTLKSHIKSTLNCYCQLYIFRLLDDLIFSISLDGQSPPSLLYNGYPDSFLGLGCGVDHSPPFHTKFKERDLYLYPLCNYMACHRADLLNLVCDRDNFSKIRSACKQHETQHTAWNMTMYTYIICVILPVCLSIYVQ